MKGVSERRVITRVHEQDDDDGDNVTVIGTRAKRVKAPLLQMSKLWISQAECVFKALL